MGILQASVPNSCWQSSQNKHFTVSSKWTISAVLQLPYQYIHQNTTLPGECFSLSHKRCSEVIPIHIFTQIYTCIQIRCVHILEHSRRRWWWCVHKYPYKHAQPCKTCPKQWYYYLNVTALAITNNQAECGTYWRTQWQQNTNVYLNTNLLDMTNNGKHWQCETGYSLVRQNVIYPNAPIIRTKAQPSLLAWVPCQLWKQMAQHSQSVLGHSVYPLLLSSSPCFLSLFPHDISV